MITGTGRSGTLYVAEALSRLGARVGHEVWFGPRPGIIDRNWMNRPFLVEARKRLGVEWRRRWAHLDGDVSWMAVPRLDRFKGIVLLQTRDPLKVVSSLVARAQFSRATTTDNPWFRFIHYNFEVTGDDLRDSMRWYVQWNMLAERHASLVYRLEDVDDDLLLEIADRVGISTRPEHVRRVLQELPITRNPTEQYGYKRLTLEWDDLPVGPEKSALRAAAHRYGYAVPPSSDSVSRDVEV